MDETGMGIKIITGGVTAARGFKLLQQQPESNIRPSGHGYDLQPGACRSAGTFTTQYCEGSSCKMG